MKLRRTNIDALDEVVFDTLVVGGGINGAVTTACLAARGAKVALIDRGDFAGETSQESSNLAWGGIKYLEGLEVKLVHELCQSRNHLIRSYPSTVEEIRFSARPAEAPARHVVLLALGVRVHQSAAVSVPEEDGTRGARAGARRLGWGDRVLGCVPP
jgi:glycerol-3-phosphate dehydrogenase